MVRQTGAAYEDEHRDPARMARWDAERSQIAYADLNGDGLNELLIFVADRDRCGTGGCDLLVLTHRTGGWVTVASTTVSRLPVYRLDSESNGWADLGVTVGGGGVRGGVARLRFDGTRYPSNPTMAPLLPTAAGRRVVLAGSEQ